MMQAGTEITSQTLITAMKDITTVAIMRIRKTQNFRDGLLYHRQWKQKKQDKFHFSAVQQLGRSLLRVVCQSKFSYNENQLHRPLKTWRKDLSTTEPSGLKDQGLDILHVYLEAARFIKRTNFLSDPNAAPGLSFRLCRNSSSEIM